MPDPRVRDFRSEDLEAAYALDQSCFEPGIAYSRAEIRFFVSRPGSIALVAETGGRLAGFAIGHERRARGHIVTIDIDAAERQRGAGRRLLSELVRRLGASGAREICLEVDVRNRGAIRFYERMGFRGTRKLSGYYGRGLDALEMVRVTSEE